MQNKILKIRIRIKATELATCGDVETGMSKWISVIKLILSSMIAVLKKLHMLISFQTIQGCTAL